MTDIFSPFTVGPITLRNRTIRSAAFEAMCPGHRPSKEFFDYHTAVARGGIGMTTFAYAAVCQSGLSFENQLWMREEIVPELKKCTDAVHAEGALCSIQLGHCGNMSHKAICGCLPYGASRGFNLYSPTFVHKMNLAEIQQVAKAYGDAVRLAIKAGFDAIEVHAGHGYLISQFLSPYTNHRHDEFGGTLENRMRFMKMCMKEVVEAGKGKVAIFVKMNTSDGFKGGQTTEELIQVARTLKECGADAIVLSGGFVSRAPQYVMRGEFPTIPLAHYLPLKQWWLKIGLLFAGNIVSPTVPFKPLFFMEDSLKFQKALGKDFPLVYVGGVVSREGAQTVLDNGFPLFQMGRAVLEDTDFVNKMKETDGEYCNGCKHSNYCIGRMYTLEMRCHHCVDNLPEKLQKEIDAAEKE